MHPCLAVDEILRHFACELVASGAKATAVALACCCRSFEDPVLDALWEAQNELAPLLTCFPRDVWEEEDGSFVSPLAVLAFPMLNRSVLKNSQENPDEGRMGPFQKVRPKNADA